MKHALCSILIMAAVMSCTSLPPADKNSTADVLDSAAISGISHVIVAQSQEKPGHNQWPASWLDKNGNWHLLYQNVSGDLRQSPSYDYAKKENAKNYRITLRHLISKDQGKSFHMIHETVTRPYGQVIPLRHPAPDGKMLALCNTPFLDNKEIPENAVVLAESSDDGITLRIRSCFTWDEKLYAADIKPFRKGLIASAYTASGKSVLFYSSDYGYHWSKGLLLASPYEGISFHEPAIEAINDTQVLCIFRVHTKVWATNYHRLILDFKDGNFLPPPDRCQDTGIGFQGRPHLMKTSQNIMILALPGNILCLSRDGGRHFMVDADSMRNLTPVEFHGRRDYIHTADMMLVEFPDGKIGCSYFIGSDFPFPAPLDEYIGASTFYAK